MDRARVTLKSLAHGGDGVATLPDGRTAFVRLGCPGDDATVEVVEDHGRWVRASIAEIHGPSPDRVEPPCPYFGVCGGCHWQHISHERQLAEKRRILVDALTRIGHLTDPEVAETVASPHAYGYRNKIELSVAAAGGKPIVGFTRAGTSDVVRVDACLLLPRRHAKLPKALSGALTFLSSRGATDILRASIRASSTGDVAVDVRTAPGPFPRAIGARILAESTGARSVTRTIVRSGSDVRDVSHVEVLAGKGVWRETLAGDGYQVSSPSFFQVNTAAAALLRQTATAALAADGTMRVADLYAGVGTFTLPLARAAEEVVAVEASKYALADLRQNLDDAGLDADIVPGDAAYALSGLGHLDAALVDPPRSGLSERGMRALVSARIPSIVYVSCDPATLARDVSRIAEAGYVADRFVPVDLFPQTYHLETVAVLRLS
ncbi:MAG: 23S rRNA (Uracil-5-)-methyltransferase RumA [Actinobacteria bacterium 66_15]|nr:MAG: 23S rRNA (Uracil-5-)-methyltransferase RumA [Actinobacteria bacterium 66_15]